MHNFLPVEDKSLSTKETFKLGDNGGFLRTGVQMNRSSPNSVKAAAAKLALEKASWVRGTRLQLESLQINMHHKITAYQKMSVKRRLAVELFGAKKAIGNSIGFQSLD